MTLEQTLHALRNDPELARNVHDHSGFVAWHEVQGREARYAPFPASADPRLIEALGRRGIEALYTHQAQAVEATLRRESVVVVTPTASGKTLCYNLPVLQSILADPSARALYLLPYEGPGAGPDDGATCSHHRGRRRHPHLHLRRRHARRCAPQSA